MRAISHEERCQKFGRFDFVADPKPHNPEHIVIRGDWVERHIVDVACPLVEAIGGPRKVNLHHLAVKPFLELWREWELRDLIKEIHTWNGSWVPRYKRGRGGGPENLSNHSWGTAFDVNASLYPLGRAVPQDDVMRELARVANYLGWFWGGDYRSRPDGMHFEYVGS